MRTGRLGAGLLVSALAAVVLSWPCQSFAHEDDFENRGCNQAGCHQGQSSTCIGCHAHSQGKLSVATDKTSYAPGSAVTVKVTISGDNTDGGWLKVRIFDANGTKLTSSNGTLPRQFTVTAPSTPGDYTWTAKALVYGGQETYDGDESGHAMDPIGQVSFTVTGSSSDTQAPSAPSNLSTSNVSSTRLTLSWSTSTDNVGVTAYDVYVGSTKQTAASSNSVVLTGLTPSTTYSLTVKARDAAGNSSSSSAAVSVTTLAGSSGGVDTQAPSAPANLTADATTSRSISLTWSASTDDVDVTAYLVYEGTVLAGAPRTNRFLVTGLAANTSHTFTVRARDAAGNVSAPSAPAIAQTSAAASTAVISVGSSAPNFSGALSFGKLRASSSRSQTFTITNNGGAVLNVALVPAPGTSSFFSVSPTAFSLAPGGRKVGIVTYAPTATDSSDGALVITSNDSVRPSVTLTLSGSCCAASSD